MRMLSALALVLLIAVAGCGDDTPTSTEDDSLLVALRVVDSDGEPLPDMRVNVANSILVDGVRGAAVNSALHVPLDLEEQSRVRMNVEDLHGTRVASLVDDVLPGGSNVVLWSGLDDSGNTVPAGRYTIRVYVFDIETSARVLLDEAEVFLDRDGDSHVVGTTGADGRLVLTDETLFPGLFLLGEMDAVDEQGEVVGVLQVLAGASFWAWPATGGPAVWTESTLFYGSNSVELVYEPGKSAMPAAAALPAAVSGAETPEQETALGIPYPNPFR